MICFNLSVGKPFNCSAVAETLRKDLVALSNLEYKNMAIALVAKSVITEREKEEIDKMTSANQMEKVINIVRASLLCNMTEKYKGLLESMEQSPDPALQAKAKQLGE